MAGELNDRIEVIAAFGHLGMEPRLFVWKRRRYPISRVAWVWTEPEGLFRQHHFTVLTRGATDLYEICFHPRDLVWHLLRICSKPLR